MKLLLITLTCLYTVGAYAAGEGRSLPSGEEFAVFVEKVFTSPEGEVQILQAKSGERSAYLRTPSGALFTNISINGTRECEAWLASGADSTTPKGCELVFSRDNGKLLRISTSDLQEASIFNLASPNKRGLNVTL